MNSESTMFWEWIQSEFPTRFKVLLICLQVPVLIYQYPAQKEFD
jgi:hypothetical protein